MLIHTPFSQTPGISRHSSISRNRAGTYEWRNGTWSLCRVNWNGRSAASNSFYVRSKAKEEKVRVYVCVCACVCACVLGWWWKRGRQWRANWDNWTACQTLMRLSDWLSVFLVLFYNIGFVQAGAIFVPTGPCAPDEQNKSDCQEKVVSLPQVCGGVRLERERRAGEEQRRSPWSRPALIFQIPPQHPLSPSHGFWMEVSQVWGCKLGLSWPWRESRHQGRTVTVDCGFPGPGTGAGFYATVLPAPGTWSDEC